MRCQKCGGFLVEEEFEDLFGGLVPEKGRAWKCLNCGKRYQQKGEMQ